MLSTMLLIINTAPPSKIPRSTPGTYGIPLQAKKLLVVFCSSCYNRHIMSMVGIAKALCVTFFVFFTTLLFHEVR